MKKLFVFALLLAAPFAHGAIFNAATCNLSDVQSAVTSSATGDTVVMPACSQTNWSSTLTITKGITLQGAGQGTTIIGDNVSKGGGTCSGGGPLVAWSVNAPNSFRMTGFTIVGVSTDPGVCQRGHVTVGGSTHTMRIDHLTINPAQTVSIYIAGDIWGLIDHFTHVGDFVNGVRVENLNWNGATNDPWGDRSWATAINYGSGEGVYIEDSSFTSTSASGIGGVTDCFSGGRLVFRHNTVSMLNNQSHGTDSDQRHRSCRWQEVYNNTYTYSNVSQLAFINWIRGGTGVFYNNAITAAGYSNKIVQVVNCRDASAGCGGGPSYTPWGACNGAGTFDQNSIGGYRCVDQPGAGTSCLLGPDAGGTTVTVPACTLNGNVANGWVGNALDPIYVWNNTLNGSSNNTTSGSDNEALNRDYFVGTARPGYTAYPYPDPQQITTWYVDPINGGPRTSAGNPGAASCTGKGTAVFNSSGIDGQACPFQVYRYLWNDPFTYQDAAWLPAGSDIMEIRNTDATHPTEVSGSTGNFGDGCWGIGPNCSPPPTPTGTAVAHTIIRGQNYAACSTTNSLGITIMDPAKAAYTWAGGGTGQEFDVTGQYIDFSCMQMRSHSSCNGINLSCSGTEWAGRALWTGSTATSANITLTNVQLTGFQSRGIIGNIGGPWTLTNTEISFNGSAGWDLDPGTGSTRDSINGVVLMDNAIIAWSGCSRQFPDVNTIPVQAQSCTYDTNGGGYGDGVGTPPDVGILSWTMNHSLLMYNTQDAIDLGHLLSGTVIYTRNILFGNAGGALKVGNATILKEYNNFSSGNCTRMAQPIPGAVSNYNAPPLSGGNPDLCRAGGDQNTFNFDPVNLPHRLDADIQFNTFIGTGATVMDAQCFGTCTPGTTGLTYTFIFSNNTVVGYLNNIASPTPPYPYNAGIAPGMWNNLLPTTEAKNLFFGLKSCPANGSDISPTCVLSPAFTSQPASPITAESQLDNYNFYPDTGSALIHTATFNASVPLDFYGVTRPNPPSVGAAEPAGTAPTGPKLYGVGNLFGTANMF